MADWLIRSASGKQRGPASAQLIAQALHAAIMSPDDLVSNAAGPPDWRRPDSVPEIRQACAALAEDEDDAPTMAIPNIVDDPRLAAFFSARPRVGVAGEQVPGEDATIESQRPSIADESPLADEAPLADESSEETTEPELELAATMVAEAATIEAAAAASGPPSKAPVTRVVPGMAPSQVAPMFQDDEKATRVHRSPTSQGAPPLAPPLAPSVAPPAPGRRRRIVIAFVIGLAVGLAALTATQDYWADIVWER